MARLDQPIRKTAIVFVKTTSGGVDKYVMEPYFITTLDFLDGTGPQTYLEPHCYSIMSRGNERQLLYDEVRVYDTPPFPRSRIGYGAPGQ